MKEMSLPERLYLKYSKATRTHRRIAFDPVPRYVWRCLGKFETNRSVANVHCLKAVRHMIGGFSLFSVNAQAIKFETGMRVGSILILLYRTIQVWLKEGHGLRIFGGSPKFPVAQPLCKQSPPHGRTAAND